MVEHEGRSCFLLEKAVCEHSEERSMLLQRAICHSPHMMDVGNLCLTPSSKMFMSVFSYKDITFFKEKKFWIFLYIGDFYGGQWLVTMPLQRALHAPSQGISTLSSETIGH